MTRRGPALVRRPLALLHLLVAIGLCLGAILGLLVWRPWADWCVDRLSELDVEP